MEFFALLYIVQQKCEYFTTKVSPRFPCFTTIWVEFTNNEDPSDVEII